VIQSIYVIHVLKTIPNMSVSIVYAYVTSHFFFLDGDGLFIYAIHVLKTTSSMFACIKYVHLILFPPFFFGIGRGLMYFTYIIHVLKTIF